MRGDESDDYCGRERTAIGTVTPSANASNSAATATYSVAWSAYAGTADIDIHAGADERDDGLGGEDRDSGATWAAADADS